MSIAGRIYQLQELDLEIESDERTLADMTAQLGENQAVLKARAEIELGQKRLEELRQQQRSLEWEVDDLSVKITRLEGELYGGQVRNPKELASIQQDIEGLKARRVKLEDRELEIMGQMEAAESVVADKDSELKKLEADWGDQQRRLSADIEQLNARLADLKHRRQLLVADIDPGTVEFYQKLRGQKGQAIVRVEQGRCRGCRILLPTSELQQARSGRLAQCGSCGRILFIA